MKWINSLFTLFFIGTSACSTQTAPEVSQTPKPIQFNEPTLILIEKQTKTPLKLKPTSISFQTLGRIFPEGNDSAGVTANIYTGNPDSRKTHYDVAIPELCRKNPSDCPVFSPVDGTVWDIRAIGDQKNQDFEGFVIAIDLLQPPKGIEKVLDQFKIDSKSVTNYSIHLGHLDGINPNLKVGSSIEKGMLLANGVNSSFAEPKIAYVLYIKSNPWLQVSPCSVSNTDSFCSKCYQYQEICLETNINYPNGGINWWNEKDPFWRTHKLSSP